MKRKRRYFTSFLYSTPSFLSGAGSVMNLAGNFYDYNTFDSGSEADRLAIENDFSMVGQDLSDVLENLFEDKNSHVLEK